LPTYTYRCKKCNTQIEYFQSIVDKPLEVCPSCQGMLERVITGGAGIIFKGSGFYITDYKNKKMDSTEKTEKKEKTEKTKKIDQKESIKKSE
jgi:putative FmdB family regulatory protein